MSATFDQNKSLLERIVDKFPTIGERYRDALKEFADKVSPAAEFMSKEGVTFQLIASKSINSGWSIALMPKMASSKTFVVRMDLSDKTLQVLEGGMRVRTAESPEGLLRLTKERISSPAL